MQKKTIGIALVIILLAAGAFMLGNFYANWQMQQQHAHMHGGMGGGMGQNFNGGGANQNSAASLSALTAVTADGEKLPLAAEVEKITGKLADGNAAQKTGDIIVVLSLNPYPATMRQPTDFSVTLKDDSGNAINDADVSLNLTMPDMWMPPNKPALSFTADGRYSATGQFTMRGWWRVEVIITRNGQTQSAFFDLSL